LADWDTISSRSFCIAGQSSAIIPACSEIPAEGAHCESAAQLRSEEGIRGFEQSIPSSGFLPSIESMVAMLSIAPSAAERSRVMLR
jgi:hypothetical protein